jgi:hypothetical protein
MIPGTSDEGIHWPKLFRRGELFIRWADVERVNRSSVTPTLHASRKRISIQLLTFRDPAAVWKLLADRLPHLSAPHR